jgi:hypothetical protein
MPRLLFDLEHNIPRPVERVNAGVPAGKPLEKKSSKAGNL